MGGRPSAPGEASARRGRCRRASAALVGAGRARRDDRSGHARVRLPSRPTRSRCGPTTPRASMQQAVAAQWDPETAIPWNAPFELADDVEDAIVQVMTYLIENETAALIVPSRFIAQLHPHFREVMQVLADPGGRRGAAHRGVHAARPAQAQPAWPLDGWRTGVAQDAGRRAGFRHRLLPAVGAGRRHVPVAAVVHRAVRARSGHARRWPGLPRRTRRGTSRSASRISASISSASPISARAWPMRSAGVTTRSPHRRPQRRGLRCAAADGGRFVGARRPAAGSRPPVCN